MNEKRRRLDDPGSDTYRLLSGVELFSTLLDDDLSYLATRMGTLSLGPGAVLFRKGEKAVRFFIVVSGEVQVSAEDGSLLAAYLPGEVLGDFDFSIGATYPAEARTVKDSLLREFPSGGLSLDDLSLEAPATVARIMLRSLGMVATRIRGTHKLMADNEPWVRELRRQVYTDAPTGLWSSAFLWDELRRSLSPPTALVMMKPDRFKTIVDRWGHQAGDEAMSLIAECLLSRVKALSRGWALRLRSNQCALLIPSCAVQDAQVQAVALAQALEAIDFRPGGETFSFTASICLGVWPEDESDFHRLYDRVEMILLKEWEDGGNRISRLPATGTRAITATAISRGGGPESGAGEGRQ